MYLWEEYYRRHKLTHLIPQPISTIIVGTTYFNDEQLWSHFLRTHQPIISSCDPRLFGVCSLSAGKTLAEQKTVIFKALPQLKFIWIKWNEFSLG